MVCVVMMQLKIVTKYCKWAALKLAVYSLWMEQCDYKCCKMLSLLWQNRLSNVNSVFQFGNNFCSESHDFFTCLFYHFDSSFVLILESCPFLSSSGLHHIF